jgi:5-methylcytosine-specific restriction enzyme A
MRRASKRCSTPGCIHKAGPTGYCTEVHAARREAALRRTTPTKRARTTEVRKHRTATVQAHLAEQDDGMGHCPGYGRPPHVVFPAEMTADDPVPIARGGGPMQDLEPLCRSCNGRKGAKA